MAPAVADQALPSATVVLADMAPVDTTVPEWTTTLKWTTMIPCLINTRLDVTITWSACS